MSTKHHTAEPVANAQTPPTPPSPGRHGPDQVEPTAPSHNHRHSCLPCTSSIADPRRLSPSSGRSPATHLTTKPPDPPETLLDLAASTSAAAEDGLRRRASTRGHASSSGPLRWQPGRRERVTTPPEIIPYYRLNHSFWSLSNNKEVSC
jgi:hypothetical protein